MYPQRDKVSLVTSSGDYVGLHDRRLVEYIDSGPLFHRDDYEVGSRVIWIDGETVYEGVIETLHYSTATMVDIKKLMPIDLSMKVPYWKIVDGRRSNKEYTPKIECTVLDDDK